MTTHKSSQDNGVWFCWDTPQFQRLRNIKQLGGVYFVYPGATHNRFEHSIGVAHLAGELVPALKTSQPELKVNKRDVLCVQFADFCHYLGHWPFPCLFGTCINKARPEKDWKVFNDPIHGTVELHPLLVKIIDTPQFQRLRYIKQLGGVYYVFPGATHNRFQHSIGVAHLAGELVKSLQTRQPELNINNRDVLCVQIAGLCHDLGHGPFSHSFEKFIHKAHPGSNWTHEKASLEMFDHLVDVNKLEPVMEQHGLVLPEDLDFIKEQIGGPPVTDAAPGQKPPKGPPPEDRRKDKPFLYEIVANKRNGVDVDKFDYLARDAHHLGIQNNFNYRRFIKFARVCEVDGQKQICTRDKEVNNLYELYHLRYTLHRKACQHSVNNIIESMITKAFLKADEHIQIQGSGKEMFTLSTAIKDMKAYTKLTDHVYEEILYSPNPKLAEAQKILKKVVARNHPRFLGERELTKTMIIKLEDMTPEAEEEMKHRWEEDLAACLKDGLKAKDFEVHIIKFDYGAKSDDPIDEMRFYNKRDLDVAFKLPDYQKSVFHPKYCSEKLIRVYYKKTDEASVKKAYKHMDLWWENPKAKF